MHGTSSGRVRLQCTPEERQSLAVNGLTSLCSQLPTTILNLPASDRSMGAMEATTLVESEHTFITYRISERTSNSKARPPQKQKFTVLIFITEITVIS
jgi:hypothetical protein